MRRTVWSLLVLLPLFGIVLGGCDSTKKAAGVPATKVPLLPRERFALPHLRVGQVAPNIEGEDLEGQAFQLSGRDPRRCETAIALDFSTRLP